MSFFSNAVIFPASKTKTPFWVPIHVFGPTEAEIRIEFGDENVGAKFIVQIGDASADLKIHGVLEATGPDDTTQSVDRQCRAFVQTKQTL